MQVLETHAESEKQALELSSKYLNTEPEFLKVKIHKKGGSRLFGFGSKQPNIYYVYAIPEKTPRDVVIRGVLSTMIYKMGYQAKVVGMKEDQNNKIIIELSSPKAANIIGRKGRTLESLQILVNTMAEKFLKNSVNIVLDIENYRDRRQGTLEKMSQRMAAQVVEKKRSETTDFLNPYERRIIHLALEDHEQVTTESVGTGNLKKVRVKLKDAPSGTARQGNISQDPKLKGDSSEQENFEPFSEETQDKDISEDYYDEDKYSEIEREQQKQFEEDTQSEQ